jgi:DNA-directed RNA polymerase specialized sigma24 family protein
LFVLCYLEGYSYEELAQVFEVERGTIASRLFRTRAVLRKDLSE